MNVRRLSFYLLCVFVFSLPWQNAISVGGSRTISSLFGAAAMWLTLSVVLAEWRLGKPSALLVSMVFFAAWQVATLSWTVDESLTLQRAMTLTQLLAMVWLIGELGEAERRRRALMQAFVLGCFISTAVLVQSWASGGTEGSFRYSPEGFSLNETATTLAVGIAFALILFTKTQKKAFYWINLVYIPLAILSVVITASRSGFVAVCIALLGVPLVLRSTRPAYRVVWSALIIGSFALLFFALPENYGLERNVRRVTFMGDTQKVGTMTDRTVIWSAGYSVFKEHPILGTGAGTFRRSVGPRLDRVRSPHNLFVSVGVETGTIGLLLVCAVLLSALLPAVRARGEPRGLYLILFAVLFAFGLAAMVDTSKVMWFGLALLSLAGREPRAVREAVPSQEPRPAGDAVRALTNPTG